MSRPKNLYLILDTETATLPCADEIASNPEEKKILAIAKPIVYNIAWQVIDKKGNVYERRSFVIQETFFVPSVFNTAYYREKRPLYMTALKNGEIEVALWNNVIKQLLKDAAKVKAVCAYNAMFDFKKAIPFTELYISKLYSNDFTDWEKQQYRMCEWLLLNGHSKSNPDFDKDYFHLRGSKFPMLDLWGLSCNHLLNNQKYKTACLVNNMISPSGLYFKTSAEATFRYLEQSFDFEESHTALEDVIIECEILRKIFKRAQKIEWGIVYFPFQELGKTVDFARRYRRTLPLEGLYNLRAAIAARMEDENKPCGQGFMTQLEKAYDKITYSIYHR